MIRFMCSAIAFALSLGSQVNNYPDICKVAIAIWFNETSQYNVPGCIQPDPQYRQVSWSSQPEIHYGWAYIDRQYYNNVAQQARELSNYHHDDLHDPWVCFLFFLKHIELIAPARNLNNPLTFEEMVKIHYGGPEWPASTYAQAKWQEVLPWMLRLGFIDPVST